MGTNYSSSGESSPTELRDVLTEIIDKERGHKIISVLAGSAISMASPAGLPIVNDFKRILSAEIISHAKNPKELTGLSDELTRPDRVAFEKLLQLIQDALLDSHPNLVLEMLDRSFGIGQPNQNHKVLTEFLARGEIQLILTTNFDDLLFLAHSGLNRVVTETQWDRLYEQLVSGSLQHPTVAHLHGSLTLPGSLVATMNQVGKELQGSRKQVLEYLLDNGVIIFVGYSGTDQDIGPIFEKKPFESQWWLIRRGSEPRETYKRQYRVVELNPQESVPDDAMLHHLFDQLSEADLLKLTGAVLIGAGRMNQTIVHFARALGLEWTNSAALQYANTVLAQRYFHLAEKLLSKTPDRNWAHWPVWIDLLAFTRRHLGRFREAAQGFAELQKELGNRNNNADDEMVHELILAAGHEIEVLLLIASQEKGDEKRQILLHCDELLGKCRFWHDNTTQLPPTPELNYYAGEIAFLRENLPDAIRCYDRFIGEAYYWGGEGVYALANLRKAVVYSAQKDWEKTFTEWKKGLWAAIKIKSFMVIVQYLAILPALFISPARGYWITRIIATRVYGLYGYIKFFLLRFSDPKLYRLILQSLILR